jgi:CheY-like chemotaxis protein
VSPRSLPYPGELAGLAALVVDDNATNLRIVSELLTGWGMAVVAARDGQRALEAVEASDRAFSVAVIDMHMPGENGLELAASLRQHVRCAAAAIVILTSSDRTEARAGAAILPDMHYLVKPASQTPLLDTIRTALGDRTAADAQPAAPAIIPTRAARRLRVLVAEDNAVNRKVTEHLLQRRGHEPVMVTNGREAVDAIAAGPYDLVLMDLQMPEMDGFEATVAIRTLQRATGSRTPIVALTAHAMEGDRQRCLDADMDGYVSKPVRAVELFEVVDRVMAAAAHSRAAVV